MASAHGADGVPPRDPGVAQEHQPQQDFEAELEFDLEDEAI